MIKIKNKIKFVTIIILSPLAIFVLLVIGYFATSPIFAHFEGKKLETLNLESKKIYKSIKNIAANDEIWKYKTGCSANSINEFPDGTYRCVTISYMEMPVSTPDEVMSLHEKYYSLFEKQTSLIAANQLGFVYPDSFGKKFVVSDAGKNYTEKKTGIICAYEAYLGQTAPGLEVGSDETGAAILNSHGTLTMMLRCEEKTGRPWYQHIKTTDGMIPDFTPYY